MKINTLEASFEPGDWNPDQAKHYGHVIIAFAGIEIVRYRVDASRVYDNEDRDRLVAETVADKLRQALPEF